jgi:hypothetical protein
MIDLSKRCHYTCVEALNNFNLHSKSILYIKSVWAPSDFVDRHNDAHMPRLVGNQDIIVNVHHFYISWVYHL